MNTPFISICIPAYKRVSYLKVLLDSIAIQNVKDFEVVITDDSSDTSVYDLQKEYSSIFTIIYKKNLEVLGTPQNWNEAIRLAQGKWIKIMHDDDWFASPTSLDSFAKLIRENPGKKFLFSGSSFVKENKVFGGMQISRWELALLQKDVHNLYFKNFIGPPSVIIHENKKDIWYDVNMKWLVDIDFYIRYLEKEPSFAFTREPLINVGYSVEQVTEKVFSDKTVFVKENLMIMQKLPHDILKRIWNYDYTWRMMRNYNIKTVRELQELYPPAAESIPEYHKSILSFQKFIPRPVLKIGIFSKLLMTISFVFARLKNKKRKDAYRS